MISKRINCIGGLLGFLAVVALPAAAANSNDQGRYPEYYAITAPKIELNPNEAVYGLTLDTIGAEIVRMNVPILWNISVDGSEGDRSFLKAHAIVGASAFGPKDLQFFNHFVEIAKEDPNRAIPPPAFDIRLVLSITYDENGKQRKVAIPLDRMMLTRLAEP